MCLQRQTPEWYDCLATLQTGYFYPWRSHLGSWNGNSVYLALVRDHLQPDVDIFEAACGHGEIALDLAPHCRSLVAYDRTAAWIDLATQAARQRGLTNVRFLCHDSSPTANGGRARLPAPDDAFDLLICRHGPFHWIEDARRVARPGAVILMLVPDATPSTRWRAWLPEALQWHVADDPGWARPAITQRLAAGNLELHSWWSFDVPEVFSDPQQLYTWLTWGYTTDEVPAFEEVRPVLDRIFAEQSDAGGVTLRRRQYLWKAVVPG